jgi:hypothetical protein
MKKNMLTVSLFLSCFCLRLFSQECITNKISINPVAPLLQAVSAQSVIAIPMQYQCRLNDSFGFLVPAVLHVSDVTDFGIGCGISWYPRAIFDGLSLQVSPLSDVRIREVFGSGFVWNIAVDVGYEVSLFRNLFFDASLGGEVIDVLGGEFVLRPYLDCSIGFKW